MFLQSSTLAVVMLPIELVQKSLRRSGFVLMVKLIYFLKYSDF